MAAERARLAPRRRPVRVPEASSPRASVIVLGWQLATDLVECVASLTESDPRTPYEVIILLNGAAPPVVEAVATKMTGAKVLTSQVNVGFGAGCNIAAQRARGEYLVFLNDDTVVHRGWLDALVATADDLPDAGAVCSRLHFPDGRLQEAGCRILREPRTLQVGRGDTSVDPALLDRRDVDYGSAAALLVRKAAFMEVGGFDVGYGPGYFEDADLRLRLRSRGWRIVYEPNAVVDHLQSGSTNADGWFREFAYFKGAHEFDTRWAAVLAGAPTKDSPLHVLCDIPILASGPPVVPPTGGLPGDEPERAVQRALGIKDEYIAWLVQRLTENQAELAARAEELAALMEQHGGRVRELTEVESQLAQTGAFAHELQAHLGAIESLGVVGLIRWRLGRSIQRWPRFVQLLQRLRGRS